MRNENIDGKKVDRGMWQSAHPQAGHVCAAALTQSPLATMRGHSYPGYTNASVFIFPVIAAAGQQSACCQAKVLMCDI